MSYPAPSTAAQSAARFRRAYETRLGFRRGATTTKYAQQFRADVLALLGCHVAKRVPQLRQELLDDLGGTISEMRVYRALRVLIAHGKVRRTPDGYLRCR